MPHYRTRQGDSLDEICWRYYGHSSLVEKVLEANPDLAEIGPVLPAGVRIVLPEQSEPVEIPVRLWS